MIGSGTLYHLLKRVGFTELSPHDFRAISSTDLNEKTMMATLLNCNQSKHIIKNVDSTFSLQLRHHTTIQLYL